MKKIEAVIDPAALEAVKLHLADAGIDGRLTMTEAKGIESVGRFYELRTANQDQWKPYLKIDLIVSDRQAGSAVNIILRRANLARRTSKSTIIPMNQLRAVHAVNRFAQTAHQW
jgi:nitrogen regulatory protein PII